MTEEEKRDFDSMNDTSYLFRVMFMNAGFDLTTMNLNSTVCWHVYYGNSIVGAVTTRKWESEEDHCTFTNLRLYKYFQERFPKCRDFLLSEYYEMKDGKRHRFNFDKCEKYMSVLREAVDGMKAKIEENQPTILGDSIARLREFCEEFDEKFSKNTLFKDVRVLLEENNRLHDEINKKSSSIMGCFMKI